MSRWVSLDEAARAVPDGASVAPGGFLLGRAPMALIFAIIRARRRELRIVSLPNPLPAELRVAAGCATLAWAEDDGYRVVQRLRAAAMGIPFIPAPDADVSTRSTLEPPLYATDPVTGVLAGEIRARERGAA